MRNIPLFKVFMAESVADKLKEVMYSGYIGEGPKVKEFEKMIGDYNQNNLVLTVNSGTSALHLAYHMALYNDEVKGYKTNNELEIISTPITCTATNTPIINNGAKIIWADVDPISGNIDPKDIENKITKNTRALAMVHWGGNPCDIAAINAIAKKHNLLTVEDGAHSMGAQYKDRPIGSDSDFLMYSFQAIKHITAVDGGCLVMKSKEHYERAKLLRWYGIDREPKTKEKLDLRCELDVVEAGYKFHMNDVCATIGIENFKHLNWIIHQHRDNAKFYDKAFAGSDKITVSYENKDGKSAYWLYTIHLNNRDEVMKKMTEIGVATSKVHARNDTHSMFKDFLDANLPNAEKFNNSHLCIPVGWWVSKEDREFIAEHIIKFAK
ncbi:MAG: putative PLP-dependent enzyme [Rickettsiaceae bacterium]|jgi:dTDP-4-amino-4,6-dideoxygalactose transaminase|nr:putative PLP-dependent enzyme [Rickettsiaceae bacterium]